MRQTAEHLCEFVTELDTDPFPERCGNPATTRCTDGATDEVHWTCNEHTAEAEGFYETTSVEELRVITGIPNVRAMLVATVVSGVGGEHDSVPTQQQAERTADLIIRSFDVYPRPSVEKSEMAKVEPHTSERMARKLHGENLMLRDQLEAARARIAELEGECEPDRWWRVTYSGGLWCVTSVPSEARHALTTCPEPGRLQRLYSYTRNEWRDED